MILQGEQKKKKMSLTLFPSPPEVCTKWPLVKCNEEFKFYSLFLFNVIRNTNFIQILNKHRDCVCQFLWEKIIL